MSTKFVGLAKESPTSSEWLDIVGCYDPGDWTKPNAGVTIYRSGVKKLGPPSPGTLYNAEQRKYLLRIKTRDFKSFFASELRDITIYPRVLNESDIMENYEAGRNIVKQRHMADIQHHH